MAKSRDEMLTIPEVIAEIGVPRATFYRWRQLRKGPKAIKLPNGSVRIRRLLGGTDHAHGWGIQGADG
ncbi:helix-turn-helix transcriptional regulator [Streptomyces alboflavus]|uniref:helix-turn-helix transcriptional regulator n=1 Tax=Streptomyces alboflavus TaxID=67267 RepID=UPI000996F744|nr:AlpA family phage regulatory protein [Streptomyces alboflavus]